MAQHDPMDTPNSDLKVDGGGVVREDEVKAKTTPNLRHETNTDNNAVFECDFTVLLDDTGSVAQAEKDRNLTAARTQAVQRGLVPTGAVKLIKMEKLSDGRNVRLVYGVPVELNTGDAKLLPGVAVAEQPDDSPADLAEDFKPGDGTEAHQEHTETHGVLRSERDKGGDN
jgi:hypothetical protein